MANEEQVALTFKDLTYSVDLGKKQGTKVILDGISGCFKPGRLTALFGASGCGKTSLMDVLARRKNTGTVEGEIRFAGAPCKKENIKHLCGYVEQFDNLVEVLTVEQMLMYTAELKLPALTRAQQLERCEEVISQLRLEECRKTVIGGELVTGISGGQKKRVNIGLSLITRPPILFLDEPTTGLDSAMADEVCVIMSLLAAQGRTVHPASSIHPCTAPAPPHRPPKPQASVSRLVVAGGGDGALAHSERLLALQGPPYPARGPARVRGRVRRGCGVLCHRGGPAPARDGRVAPRVAGGRDEPARRGGRAVPHGEDQGARRQARTRPRTGEG